MREWSDETRAMLRGYDLPTLWRDPSVIYALTPDLRLAFHSESWMRFHEANGGGPGFDTRWGPGCRALDAIQGPLRSHFERVFRLVIHSGEVWQHTYECSSAAVFRQFHLRILPLPEQRGLLLVNSLIVERAHSDAERAPHSAVDTHYIDAHGIAHQCSHCRRMRRVDLPEDRWDWVPDWVTAPPPRTSHGLCEVCLLHHYPPFESN